MEVLRGLPLKSALFILSAEQQDGRAALALCDATWAGLLVAEPL